MYFKDAYNALRECALQNGLRLLEYKWLGSSTKHRFKHAQTGYIYSTIPGTIMKSKKFPNKLRTPMERINDMHKQATKSGFKLLESEWLGSEKQHRFQHVANGKVYQFLPGNIKRRGFPKDVESSTCKQIEVLDISTTSSPDENIYTLTQKIGNLFFNSMPPADTFMPPSCTSNTLNADSTSGITYTEITHLDT